MKLKRLKQTLKKVGITVEKDRISKGNIYTIKRKEAEKSGTLDNFLTENNESVYSENESVYSADQPYIAKPHTEAESDGSCRDVGCVGLDRNTLSLSKKAPSHIQKFLLDRSSGASFMPSSEEWEKKSEILFTTIESGYIEECVDDEGKLVKGEYRLTNRGREQIAEWKK
jgi:hypothetical protein